MSYNASQLKDSFPYWIVSSDARLFYDIFLNHRWGKEDTKIVTTIYDRQSLHVVGDSHRIPQAFLDSKRLLPGESFRDGFFVALMHSIMVVIILSYDALLKMRTHDSTSTDNVLLEYLLAIVFKHLGLVEKIYPILIGKWSVSPRGFGNLFNDRIIDTLPEVVPIRTIQEAELLFHKHGLVLPDWAKTMTVKGIVRKVSEFLGYTAWVGDYTGSDRLYQLCCDNIITELKTCSPERLNRRLFPDPSPVTSVPTITETNPAIIASNTEMTRNIDAAWAFINEPKNVLESEQDKLTALLNKLGVESATDFKNLFDVEGWKEDFETIITYLRKAKRATL